jgi:hypothetical protein
MTGTTKMTHAHSEKREPKLDSIEKAGLGVSYICVSRCHSERHTPYARRTLTQQGCNR